ncbi:hypothetical protein ED733_000391 [Metarhizium rileyi]|uniref:CENP-V/GFA domain-containing protein n=1 Tax=Metarhizium rileyi (strain RCEF 4871) TaxID=1649241 RepID=A0A5C6G6V4_METRR|nr:hypothetical protein ED733_000391 [Metarhizium rileyi]
MTGLESSRQPVTGSCHCGTVKYVIFITLPPVHNESNPPGKQDQRIYRCNCTMCHKAGFFHVRVANTTDDFLLLSPLNPLEELGDYLVNKKVLHWLYCMTCGVRCFTFMGTGEVVHLDLAQLGVPGYLDTNIKTRVWRAKEGGGHPDYGTYLSVNGNTVDASATVFDMRSLVEQKCVQYYDYLAEDDQRQPVRYRQPHRAGCY